MGARVTPLLPQEQVEMNYCHKCQCSFSQPGTCNCFAAPVTIAPRQSAPAYGTWCATCGHRLHAYEFHVCPGSRPYTLRVTADGSIYAAGLTCAAPAGPKTTEEL